MKHVWVILNPEPVMGESGFEGVFLTEEEAAAAATESECIALVEVGCRPPSKAADVIKLYWPKLERWEDSALYRLRNAQ